MKQFLRRPTVIVFAIGVVSSLLFISYYFLIVNGPASSDERGHSAVQVILTDAGFVPQYIRIRRGTMVTFTTTRSDEFWPASNPHPSHSIYPAFDPKVPIQPNDSWSFTFDRVGVWGYHDHIRSYFTGIVQVDE